MKRHLKVITKFNDNITFSVALLQQTHVAEDFGNFSPEKSYGTIGFIFGNVCLISGSDTLRIDNDTPWGNIPAKHLIVWLLYREEYLADLPKFNEAHYPIEWWPRVKAAIEAYNELYKE